MEKKPSSYAVFNIGIIDKLMKAGFKCLGAGYNKKKETRNNPMVVYFEDTPELRTFLDDLAKARKEEQNATNNQG